MLSPHLYTAGTTGSVSTKSVAGELAQIPLLKPEAEDVAVGNRSGRRGRVQASLRAATLPFAGRYGRSKVLICSSRVGRVATGSPVIRGQCSGAAASIAKGAARV